MFVVTNRIPVAKGMEAQFEERFRGRAKLVDQEPGFIRNDVLRPVSRRLNRETGKLEERDEQGYYLIRTCWASEQDFWNWTQSESFRTVHANRPPAELFAGRSVLEVHEVVMSSEGKQESAPKAA